MSRVLLSLALVISMSAAFVATASVVTAAASRAAASEPAR
jgi:hypothetical protein